MPDTTIPSVIDALVTMAQGLTLPTAPPDGTPVQVSDGFPGTFDAPDIVAVGGMVEPVVDGEQDWANLGALSIDERYDVHCYITALRGGTTDQKPARDAAFAIFKAFQSAHRSNLRLGIHSSGQTGVVLWSQIGRVGVKFTDSTDAAEGRRCTISFVVHVLARI